MFEQTLLNLCAIYEKASGKKATKLYLHPSVMTLLNQEFYAMGEDDPPKAANLDVVIDRALPEWAFYVGG